MAGSTLKEGICLLDGWLHIEGRDRYTEWLAPHRRKGNVYWMDGSTLKEGIGLLAGWLHIEGTGLLDGWLHIEGRGRFNGWLAPR